jgi:F5/8 type C domain
MPSGALELLRRTASVVVTSSHADGNSTGAYLVDDLLQTSWRANPPDSAPWIEIDLPAPALIDRIELVVAQASPTQRDSLARTARLQAPVASASESWVPLQTQHQIATGDEVVLQLTSTEARPKLRVSLGGAPRLAIAELRVIGRIAPEQLLEPALPETQVQGNPRSDYPGDFGSWLLGAPYASEAALCRAFAALPDIDPDGQRPLQEICHKLPAVAVQGSPPAAIRAVERYALTNPDEVFTTELVALVVRGERGLYPANLSLTDERNDGLCPGGPEGRVSATNFRFEHGVLLIDRTREASPGTLMMNVPESAPPVSASSVVRCRLEGRLSCREFITRYSTPGKPLEQTGDSTRVKAPASWSRTLSVTARGSVRLSPCQAPPQAAGQPQLTVPCATPGAEVL